MTEQQAMRLARQEYRRLTLEGMGIFLIAEAWDIPAIRYCSDYVADFEHVRSGLPKHLRSYGVLTEPYVLQQMAKQIRGLTE